MDIEGILREIDAEIDKLQRIRSILDGLSRAAPKKAAKTRRGRVIPLAVTEPPPEPRLIVLPPKQKREYTRRVKPVASGPKALAAPVSSKPVFVPKAATLARPLMTMDSNESALEAAMRQKLLGGAA